MCKHCCKYNTVSVLLQIFYIYIFYEYTQNILSPKGVPNPLSDRQLWLVEMLPSFDVGRQTIFVFYWGWERAVKHFSSKQQVDFIYLVITLIFFLAPLT